jgi:hypothetical protein
MTEVLTRRIENVLGRVAGPLTFRLFLKPVGRIVRATMSRRRGEA